jgi:hypothetical protein
MRLYSTPLSLSLLTALVGLAAPALAQDVDVDADVDADADVKVRSADRGLPEVRVNSPSGRFGTKGQKAVSSDAGISVSNTSISGVDGSTTTLVVRPAVDWFFAESISFGGFAGVEYNSAPGGSSSVISIGPRLGYNLPVSDRLSVWPKLGFSLANTTVNDDSAVGDDEEESNTSIQLNLFAPLMFHPVQHFFLGFGPALDIDLSGDAKATTIAARLTIGGWL